MTKRVADFIVEAIASSGVETVFGLTGGGIMYLIDAIAQNKNIDFQPVHHEEFAAVCADGYARSGKPFGVAFATTGPGVAHLFAGVAAAWQDSVPMLLVVGQVKTSDSSRLNNLKLRQNGTFEFDSIPSFSPITKSAKTVSNYVEATRAITEGIDLCQSGRPGPVLIEIPLDVQAELIPANFEEPAPHKFAKDFPTNAKVEASFERELHQSLQTAKRPLLLFGAGAIRANAKLGLRYLLEQTNFPYLVTQFARELGSFDDPHFLGSPGIKANRSANIALSRADYVVMIGTSLHQQVIGWNESAFRSFSSRKVWTEIDQETIKSRRHLVDEVFRIDTLRAIDILASVLGQFNFASKDFTEWTIEAQNLREEFMLHFPQHSSESDSFCLYKAVSQLSGRSERFGSVVTDAGLVWYAVPQHMFIAKQSHFISSGSFGAMGMALPYAIGSGRATKRQVLCITGDGSLMTCLSELATLSNSRLPVLLVVNSNDGYVSIRATHNKFFEGRKLGTDSTNGVFIPKIKDIAHTMNIPYFLATSEKEFEEVLDNEEVRNLAGPCIVEILTYKDQVIEPVVISKVNPMTGRMESGSLVDMFPEVKDNKTR